MTGESSRVSGSDETRDGLGGLADLLVRFATAGSGRLDDAMAEVLLEQAERDRLQGLRHRRDLGEDVDAVLLVLDHPLQSPGLALDAAESLEVLVLAVDVAVLVLAHRGNYTPLGFMASTAGGRSSAGRSAARPGWSAAGRRRRGRSPARPAGPGWSRPRRGSARRPAGRACGRRAPTGRASTGGGR